MEIFNNLIQTLTTPDEELTNIICSPLMFIEAIVSMLLFTTILNIKRDKRSMITYVIALPIISLISKYFLPTPYSTIINILIFPFLVYFLFKTTILKSIIAQIIPFVISVLVETLLSKFYFLCFGLFFYF